MYELELDIVEKAALRKLIMDKFWVAPQKGKKLESEGEVSLKVSDHEGDMICSSLMRNIYNYEWGPGPLKSILDRDFGDIIENRKHVLKIRGNGHYTQVGYPGCGDDINWLSPEIIDVSEQQINCSCGLENMSHDAARTHTEMVNGKKEKSLSRIDPYEIDELLHSNEDIVGIVDLYGEGEYVVVKRNRELSVFENGWGFGEDRYALLVDGDKLAPFTEPRVDEKQMCEEIGLEELPDKVSNRISVDLL